MALGRAARSAGAAWAVGAVMVAVALPAAAALPSVGECAWRAARLGTACGPGCARAPRPRECGDRPPRTPHASPGVDATACGVITQGGAH